MKKLFVDDNRKKPENGYDCAEDYYEAVRLLERNNYDFASFDYDLGVGQNGLQVLIWMKQNGKYIPRINIHSSHSLGRSQMKNYCETNFPGVKVTMEPFDYSKK